MKNKTLSFTFRVRFPLFHINTPVLRFNQHPSPRSVIFHRKLISRQKKSTWKNGGWEGGDLNFYKLGQRSQLCQNATNRLQTCVFLTFSNGQF